MSSTTDAAAVKALQIQLMSTRGMLTLPPALDVFLPAAERQRAQLLRRPQDHINRMAAYALLFKMAAERSGLPVHTIKLQRDAHDKPQLQCPAGHPALHANLSHSGELVAVALADRPVGIDIEQVKALDWQALRHAHFAHDPWPQDLDPLLALHQLWCCKEAVLKAVGYGLTVPLSAITLQPPSKQFQPLHSWPEASTLEGVQVALIDAPTGYVGAIAKKDPYPSEVSLSN